MIPLVSLWALAHACTKILTLAITSEQVQIRLSYFTCIFLVTRPFTTYHNFFYLVTLILNFDLLIKNFNLGHNFLKRRGRVFIFHICISYDKTFHHVP